jgi:DnaD/phage-associated family protein
MARGDRAILKADPDDGTTPVANLLLEAMAVAPLNGTEKGAMCYLMRKTYGWTNGNGQRKKEAEIPLAVWARALATHVDYAQRVIAGLVDKKVFLRVDEGKGKGYVYSINTRVDQWLDGRLISLLPTNQSRPDQSVGRPKSRDSTKESSQPPTNQSVVPPTNQSVVADTDLGRAKESIKETLNKDDDDDNNGKQSATEVYEQNFGELTPLIEEELSEAIKLFSEEWVTDALKEAAKAGDGKKNWKYVAGILKNWRRKGRDSTKNTPDPDKYVRGKYGQVVKR